MAKSADEPPEQRYRAFLSYSHRDSVWGAWAHSSLENYRIPKELVGRTTPNGEVPAKLRPIFRDRFDLAASHTLAELIDAALQASDNLIVLCSQASAKSPYVNEEIRRFKEIGKGDRILALIIDGEPHDPERECFPAALKFKIDPTGKLTDQPDVEPIAADAREHADGKDLAKLKLIAGLLGIGLDEIRKREAAAERRRRRVWMSVAGAMAVLAIVAVAGFWEAVLRSRDAERRFEIAFNAAEELVQRVDTLQDRFGVPEAVLEAMMRDAIGQLDRLTQENGASSDIFQFKQAEAHLLASDLAKRRGDATERQGRLEKAVALLTPLAASDPQNEHGWREELANALMRRADLQWDLNDHDAAKADYQSALTITGQLAALPAASPDVRHDLANDYSWFAHKTDTEADREALLQKSLSILRPLATDFPKNATYQRTYAVTLIDLGQAQASKKGASKDDISAGADLEMQAITLLKATHDAQPANSDISWLLGSAFSKHGDILVREGRVADALADYRSDLQLMRGLSDANPDNAVQQLDAAVSSARVAVILQNTGQTDAALELFRDALRREQHVAALDPSRGDFQDRVARRLTQIANLQKGTDQDGAVTTFRQATTLYDDLAKQMPTREDYAAQRVVQHAFFGRFLNSLNRYDDAVDELSKARDIATASRQQFSNQKAVDAMIGKLDSDIATAKDKKQFP